MSEDYECDRCGDRRVGEPEGEVLAGALDDGRAYEDRYDLCPACLGAVLEAVADV